MGPAPLLIALVLVGAPARAQGVDGGAQAADIVREARRETGAAPAAAPCRSRDQLLTTLSTDQCAAFNRLDAVMDRLLAAAGIERGPARGQIRLVLDERSRDPWLAHFAPVPAHDGKPAQQFLVVSRGWLNAFGAKDAVALQTLAHELGHAVQFRNDPGFAHDLAPMTLEAQADAIGLQLALAAGYEAAMFQKGMETWVNYGCADIMLGKEDGGGDHPASRDRWINELLAAEALQGSPRSAGAGFQPAAAATDFDESGRLKTSADAGGDAFLGRVAAAWSRAREAPQARGLDEAGLRETASRGCGMPGVVDLRAALDYGLAHPGRIVMLPMRPLRSPGADPRR